MSIHNIKRFSIYGLFGINDVHIPFNENIKILIGENGLGKTQVLNIFYYTLITNFSKLSEFSFEKIELILYPNNKLITISKKECQEYVENYYEDLTLKKLVTLIGFEATEKLIKKVRYRSIIETRHFIKNNPQYNQINQIAPVEYIFNLLREESSINKQQIKKTQHFISNDFANKVSEIKQNFPENTILYFPTFRRVEEDLYNLGYDDEDFFINTKDIRLINFGMDDVQKRFDAIEKKIDLLLKEGFSQITSEILSKLVKGFGETNKNILDGISEADIDIILARVGNQIPETDKSRIRDIVFNKKISDADNSLFYFIQILINIYEKQKELDSLINRFQEVCNEYLIGKQVSYDESNIKIYIESDNSNELLTLNQLSSGEKQIISIFSTIYLSEENDKFIVLFDEPELSLSMTWQKKLLPDIVNSGKCDISFSCNSFTLYF